MCTITVYAVSTKLHESRGLCSERRFLCFGPVRTRADRSSVQETYMEERWLGPEKRRKILLQVGRISHGDAVYRVWCSDSAVQLELLVGSE